MTIAPILVIAALAILPQADSSRIYGVVTTTDGDTYRGYIRWDKNEASWDDLLHASKRIPERHLRKAERLGPPEPDPDHSWIHRLAHRLFEGHEPWGVSSSAEVGIRFGHLLTLERRGSGARGVLVSGQEVELRSGGDIGGAVREIVVETGRAGNVKLEWDDVDRVDFLTADASAGRPSAQRLYGTLTTQSGQKFTGYVGWDLDEALDSDVLDGEEDGRDREIPFREIREIRRRGDDGARVLLKSGREILLRDSNDVDDSNRGIIITEPSFGQARVDWDEFRSLELSPPPAQSAAPTRPAGPLRGRLETTDGRTMEGDIRWDNDEEYTWELLNGTADGVGLEIEFGAIRSIERMGRDGALVTLRDGREFRLHGSNDVNGGNRGIFLRLPGGGGDHGLTWAAFRRVEFR